MKLTLVPDELEDEDMMEMLAAGLLRLIVVDDWKAKLWSGILPNIQLRPELAVRSGAKDAQSRRGGVTVDADGDAGTAPPSVAVSVDRKTLGPLITPHGFHRPPADDPIGLAIQVSTRD